MAKPLKSYIDQLEALHKLDDEEVVVVLDGKNNVGSFADRLLDKGVNVAHFYIQPREGVGISVLRHGADTRDAYGKGDDFSDLNRNDEIQRIFQQHKSTGVKAIIIPFASCQCPYEIKDTIKKLKTLMRDVPIIKHGVYLKNDKSFFTKIPFKIWRDLLQRREDEAKILYNGENGVESRLLDAYTSGDVDEFVEAIEKLTTDKQRGR